MSFNEKARTNEFEVYLKNSMVNFDANGMGKHFSDLFDDALEDKKYIEIERFFRSLISTYLPELDCNGLFGEFDRVTKHIEGNILDFKSFDAGMYLLRGINVSHCWAPPESVSMQILMCYVYDDGVVDFPFQYESTHLSNLKKYGFPEYNEDWNYWLACRYLEVFMFSKYAQLLKEHSLDYLPFSISLMPGVFEAELAPSENASDIENRTLCHIRKKIHCNELELQDELERRKNDPLPVTNDEFIVIPPGNYHMGSPPGEEGRNKWERLHTVDIERFELMKMPVTYAQYYIYRVATDNEPPPEIGLLKGTYPIVNVSYWEAVAFVEWLTAKSDYIYRLPTEAEWEYACRAGTNSAYWYGHEPSKRYMRYDLKFRSDDISKVGKLEPNPLGLFDMHGNINEWCSSEWDENYGGKENLDHSGDKTNVHPRVIRGGCYYYKAQNCRSAWRNRASPNYGKPDVGFRIARTKKT